MNKKLRFFLQLLFIIALCFFLYTHKYELSKVSWISPAQFIFLEAFILLLALINAGLNQTLLQFFNKEVSLLESFSVLSLINFLDPLFPKAGLAFRLFYFKKNHSTELSHFFILLTHVAIIAFLLILFILFTCLTFYFQNIKYITPLFFLLLFSYFWFKGTISFNKLFPYQKLHFWPKMLQQRNLQLRLWVYSFLNQLALGGVFYLILQFIGSPKQWTIVFLISSCASLGALLSILPAGLGTVELLIYFTGKSFGIDTQTIISISVLFRVASFSFTFLAVIPSIYILRNKMHREIFILGKNKSF